MSEDPKPAAFFTYFLQLFYIIMVRITKDL